MTLKNKIVVITGASQGLGKTLALKVAAEGGKVALVARSADLLKKVQTEVHKSGGEAEFFVCDIRNLFDIQKTVAEIQKKFSTIDILVNNAGIWTDNEMEQSDPSRRQAAFETNVVGHINFTNEVLPYFKKQNAGYVLNVISTSGVVESTASDNRFWSTYGATKWAMTGFTTALQASLSETKIKVTGFFPGGFDSNLYENADRPNAHHQAWMMKTEDIADIIVFALTRPADVVIEKMIVTKSK